MILKHQRYDSNKWICEFCVLKIRDTNPIKEYTLCFLKKSHLYVRYQLKNRWTALYLQLRLVLRISFLILSKQSLLNWLLWEWISLISSSNSQSRLICKILIYLYTYMYRYFFIKSLFTIFCQNAKISFFIIVSHDFTE